MVGFIIAPAKNIPPELLEKEYLEHPIFSFRKANSREKKAYEEEIKNRLGAG